MGEWLISGLYHFVSGDVIIKKRNPLRGCYFRMGTSIAGAQAPELLNAGGVSMPAGIDEGSALDLQAFEKACAKLLIWAISKLFVLSIICQPPKSYIPFYFCFVQILPVCADIIPAPA